MTRGEADAEVAALMARVKAGAARRRGPSGDDVAVDALLATATERAAARDRWPQSLRTFPFTLPALQRAVLRVAARLSRDQRAVNEALIAAVRAQSAQVAELEARLRELEERG